MGCAKCNRLSIFGGGQRQQPGAQHTDQLCLLALERSTSERIRQRHEFGGRRWRGDRNVITRTVGATAYTLTYDAENRLTGVSGGATATFVYDGDGNRVKTTIAGTTTAYVGNYYELSGSAYKQYYYARGQRVALNDNGTLKWLLGDHLGSTSLTADGTTGAFLTELRYKPWGENRYTSGTTPTTYRFTGQRQESALGGAEGLYFYVARWYDPATSRFLQADTIVPGAGNPQALNRYAYVYNSPLNYTDPTGHCVDNNRNTTGSNAYDCTIDELQVLDWDIRIWWLDQLSSAANADGWFNDVRNIMVFFSQNPLLPGPWLRTANAGVLKAIGDGLLMFQNKQTSKTAAGQWAEFLRAIQPGNTTPYDERKRLHAAAEGAGAQGGYDLAMRLVGAPQGLEGRLVNNFKNATDLFRGISQLPYRGGIIGWGVGGSVASAVCSSVTYGIGCGPVRWAGQAAGFIAGELYTDPRTSPTYISAWTLTALTVVYEPVCMAGGC